MQATQNTASQTKVITGKVRLSYVNLFKARASDNGGDPRYGCTLLIPKSDTTTINAMKAAIEVARQNARAKMGDKAKSLKHTLHDGDGEKPNGGEYGPECKGCYVLNVSSKQRPQIIDRQRNPITDSEDVYSGCYARVSVNFYAYDVSGNRGIAAGLNNVQKVADGEFLGGRANAEDEFDEYEDDDDFMN